MCMCIRINMLIKPWHGLIRIDNTAEVMTAYYGDFLTVVIGVKHVYIHNLHTLHVLYISIIYQFCDIYRHLLNVHS